VQVPLRPAASADAGGAAALLAASACWKVGPRQPCPGSRLLSCNLFPAAKPDRVTGDRSSNQALKRRTDDPSCSETPTTQLHHHMRSLGSPLQMSSDL